MARLDAMALRVDGRQIWVLDQTRLPFEEAWVDGTAPEAMVDLIRRLAVRGAPLIGVAAALSLGAYLASGVTEAEGARAAEALRQARPTAVNLMWALDRVRGGVDPWKEAVAIFEEDVALCEALAGHGAPLVERGESLLTHCNAGALATAGIGTAVGVIRRACEQGRVKHVYVDETRPLLQGARLTAWELMKLGIPHTLLTDSMAAILLREGRVQRVFVGADRIAANGDFANKVGTYGLAVNARFHGVPFHPVAPYSTVDATCATGAHIPIEERLPEEVRGYGEACWNAGSPAFNPSFDVTPVDLVTSLVLDRGVIPAEVLARGGWA